MAWQQGRSAKHPSDIREMLVFSLGGLSGETLDLDYVATRAVRLEPEATDLWFQVLKRAREDVAKFR